MLLIPPQRLAQRQVQLVAPVLQQEREQYPAREQAILAPRTPPLGTQQHQLEEQQATVPPTLAALATPALQEPVARDHRLKTRAVGATGTGAIGAAVMAVVVTAAPRSVASGQADLVAEAGNLKLSVVAKVAGMACPLVESLKEELKGRARGRDKGSNKDNHKVLVKLKVKGVVDDRVKPSAVARAVGRVCPLKERPKEDLRGKAKVKTQLKVNPKVRAKAKAKEQPKVQVQVRAAVDDHTLSDEILLQVDGHKVNMAQAAANRRSVARSQTAGQAGTTWSIIWPDRSRSEIWGLEVAGRQVVARVLVVGEADMDVDMELRSVRTRLLKEGRLVGRLGFSMDRRRKGRRFSSRWIEYCKSLVDRSRDFREYWYGRFKSQALLKLLSFLTESLLSLRSGSHHSG